MILSLCDRFHKLPSEVLKEGADLIRMVRLVDYARAVAGG